MAETVPCPGCGGEGFETIHEDCRDLWFGVPGSFSVVRCRDCGLVSTNPRPTPSELEAFYLEAYAPEGFSPPNRPPGSSALVRAVRWVAALPYRLRWGKPFISRVAPGRVLDIGAGDGSRLGHLKEEGWEPWILEPRSEIAARTARSLGIPDDRVIVGFAEDADLPEAFFDLVVMDHTVEHLSDPRAVFESIARSLKPGGRLLITCPNYESLESRVFGRGWMGLDIPRHLLHFGVESLSRVASGSGLSLEDVRPQYGVLVVPSFIFGQASRQPPGQSAGAVDLGGFRRLTTFGLELVATVGQAFGYMPMMEVVFVRESRQEA